jgi:signal transduction histidine kinase
MFPTTGAPGRHETGWRRGYRATRDALLLRRLRWCVGLTFLGVLIAALGVLLDGPPGLGKRLAFCFKFAAACLAAWELARGDRARSRAQMVGLGYVVVLIGLVGDTLNALPGDRVAAPAAYVAVMMGSALLLPWGVGPQAVTCALAAAAYGWIAGRGSGPIDTANLSIVITTVPVALVGALLIDRYREISFLRSWQQRQMVALARALARAAEPEAVIAKVLAHARRALGAESAAFSAYEASRRVFRVEGLKTARDDGPHWMEGLEVPEDFPLIPSIVGRGILAIPDEDPAFPIRALLDEHGARRVLYLALRCGGELVGILCVVRTRDVPFERVERQLARALADQAALALRTARLVADLRRANRLKSEFVSTMSHELRTPLTVILGFAEMARDAALAGDERNECLGRIETSGRDLLGLIETTLEIGKMDAGRDEVQLEPVPLPAFWATIGDACQRLPRNAAVELEWDGDVPGIALVTDPRKLTVVVRNLVGNALKFTARGSVRVTLRREEERIVLRVADTGIGIRPEDHATVFEMFRQADGSESRRYEGTGLGLYIVHRFVQQLGGTLALESAPGRGSVFTITLPCVIDAPPLERAA